MLHHKHNMTDDCGKMQCVLPMMLTLFEMCLNMYCTFYTRIGLQAFHFRIIFKLH